MLSNKDLRYLEGLSIFAGLRHDILQSLGKHTTRVDLAPGTVLFREGEPAKEMLVVLDGRLDVIKHNHDGREACIAQLGPGDVAGEMSLIDIQPRSAEVRSVGPSSVAVLTHADIATIYREDMQSYTLLVLNIAREISLRLRRLDDLLARIIFDIGRATHGGDPPSSPMDSNG